MINSKIDWKLGTTINDVTIEWIPICSVAFGDDYKRIIGLTKEEFWINGFEPPRTEGLYIIKNREDCYHIMAIIDKERIEIEELVKNGLKLNGMLVENFNTFPIKEIIKFSLTSTRHWGIRAATWIRQEEFDEELCDITRMIIEKKELDQRSRHDLFKMMKRFEKQKAS
ncbi:hypothetical protein V9L05_18415 [Bernardetia sp. Wsw4-3y2]|uniref:hypothetical protein n=1 Tax=Bernardetia sp. Wsw4-3y2 TaxID=3127471 RepID=UPI0030D17D9F